MSPKARHELAREHLDRGLAGVTAGDSTEAVTWLFLSLEAAIVAVADQEGLETKKQHWLKADVAKELHRRGVLPRDFSSTLRLLNEARKVATYEGDDPDLEGQSLEDIATDVEIAVGLAEKAASS
jgi:uncharacterized protein YutE (UPF0331/DUF86 family)